MPVSDKLIAQLLEVCSSPDDILGEDGPLKQLTEKVAVSELNVEMNEYLGCTNYDPAVKNTDDSRKSRKSVRSIYGAIGLEVPRYRNGTFEPKLVRKGEK